MKPTAKYIGKMRNTKGEKFKMYTVIGGRHDGSTVTEPFLEYLRIQFPDPSDQRPLERPDEEDGD